MSLLAPLNEPSSDIAVINIGSNSVKMYIPTKERFGFKKVLTTQLAAGAKNDGRLLELCALSRSFDAVRELVGEARNRNIDNIFIYGTEALRRAENGYILTDRIKQETALTVELIDGQTEALCAVLGVRSSFPKHHVFIDIGGASTEAAKLDGEEIKSDSFPIGAVRLEQAHGQDFFALKAKAESEIGSFERASHLIGLGGTFTALASASLGLKEYSPEKVHGAVLNLSKLKALARELSPLSADDTERLFPVLTKPRARVLKAGLAIVVTVAERFNAEDFTVSADDGLKGYAVLKSR